MKKLTYLMLMPLLLATSCSPKNMLNDKTLVIGCSPTPHAEILREAKPLFEDEGYKLDIQIIQDYVTPNALLQAGDLDANYFQHVPYLDDFNEKNHTDLTWILKVHFEPMGIYSSKYTDFAKVNPTIAIPNDKSNGERARALLEEWDVTGTIIEMEAQAIPSVLADVDYGVINGNYALSAQITDKCIVTESKDSETAQRLANVIAVKTSSLNFEWIDVIKRVMTSNKMRTVINTYFGSSVIAVF